MPPRLSLVALGALCLFANAPQASADCCNWCASPCAPAIAPMVAPNAYYYGTQFYVVNEAPSYTGPGIVVLPPNNYPYVGNGCCGSQYQGMPYQQIMPYQQTMPYQQAMPYQPVTSYQGEPYQGEPYQGGYEGEPNEGGYVAPGGYYRRGGVIGRPGAFRPGVRPFVRTPAVRIASRNRMVPVRMNRPAVRTRFR